MHFRYFKFGKISVGMEIDTMETISQVRVKAGEWAGSALGKIIGLMEVI